MTSVSNDNPEQDLHPQKSAGAYADHAASVLAGILESVDDLFVAIDADLRLVAFNAAFRREFGDMFGKTPSLGQSLRDQLAGDAERHILGDLAQRAFSGEAFSLVQDIVDRTNRRKFFQISVTPVPDVGGRAVVVALVARDITEKREAEQKFLQLLEASPDAMLVVQNGVIEQANAHVEKLFGYPSRSLQGKPLELLVPRNLRAQHVRQRQSYESAPKTRPMGIDMTLYGLRADGTTFPVEVSLSPLTVGDQKMVVAAVRDITVRRRIEENLRHENAELKEMVAGLAAQLRDARQRKRSEEHLAEHYRSVFEQGAVGIAVAAPDGRFIQVNQWLCDMTGYQHDELLERRMHDITHGEDLEADLMLDTKLLQGVRSSYMIEKRLYRKDGGMIWVNLSASIKRDAAGKPQHFVFVMADITRRKDIEQRLADAHLRLKMATEIGRLGFWERDFANDEMYFSPEWMAQTGYLEGEIPATLHEWSSRLHPEDRDRVLGEVRRYIENPRGEHQFEYRYRHRDGSYRWFLSRMIALNDPTGKANKVIGIRLDITERKEAERAIRQEGQHDALTGLPNRRLIVEYAEHIVANAQRSGVRGAIVFIDLDRFKEVNDTYGHEAGDTVLREVARRLSASIRKGDIAGRLGGDEFLVILPQIADALSATAIAEELLSRLNKPHRIGEMELEITPSIGVALFPGNGDDIDTLIRRADHAMYVAKDKGRGRVQVYTPEMARRADDAITLENNLKAALQKNEFELHFQPISSTETNRVIGAEALLRWHSEQDRLMHPGEFISIAESSGLIGELGKWVLSTACRQQVQWAQEGMSPLRIAINISPAQFRQKTFVADLARSIGEIGIDPAMVQLEIVESAIMQDLDKAIDVLDQLHTLGVRVAIDNFGTGGCDLGSLSKLTVDTLKIDVSFVRELDQDARSETVAQAAIALGRSLNLEMVAEGVESEQGLACVRQHQCGLVQGFHVGRPMTGGEFQRWYWQHAH